MENLPGAVKWLREPFIKYNYKGLPGVLVCICSAQQGFLKLYFKVVTCPFEPKGTSLEAGVDLFLWD